MVIPNEAIHMWNVGASYRRGVAGYFVPFANAVVIDVAYDVVLPAKLQDHFRRAAIVAPALLKWVLIVFVPKLLEDVFLVGGIRSAP